MLRRLSAKPLGAESGEQPLFSDLGFSIVFFNIVRVPRVYDPAVIKVFTAVIPRNLFWDFPALLLSFIVEDSNGNFCGIVPEELSETVLEGCSAIVNFIDQKHFLPGKFFLHLINPLDLLRRFHRLIIGVIIPYSNGKNRPIEKCLEDSSRDKAAGTDCDHYVRVIARCCYLVGKFFYRFVDGVVTEMHLIRYHSPP